MALTASRCPVLSVYIVLGGFFMRGVPAGTRTG
jgi:hypothetical protein